MATVLIVEDNPAMKGDEARIRAAGGDGYIAKPLTHEEFLAVVSAQLVAAPR